MYRTQVAIIGGGQAGLAMSHVLAHAGVDHVILERGQAGSRWLAERAAHGRLLTPNWMTRLPGWTRDGMDGDGFMTFGEVAGMLSRYAASFDAPLLAGADVRRVRRQGRRYRVASSRGDFLADAVVIATGHCQQPFIPRVAAGLDPDIGQLAAGDYVRAGRLAPGGVLVVGASASGVQIAEDLALHGRDVILAAGSHTRLPRRYRGRDIMWWLDRSGILDDSTMGSEDISRPSLQLAGCRSDHAPDLPTLKALGVRLAGRAIAFEGRNAVFADDLAGNCAAADRRMRRTLMRIEAMHLPDMIDGEGGVCPPPAFLPEGGVRKADLSAENIATVIWATGYRRSYPWLDVPVLDSTGEIRQFGGITAVGGLYVIGLNAMRCRKSSFIDGVGRDATELGAHLLAYLGQNLRRAA
ncbi:MAG: NAD(P)/FAD-dependent oxidoreductase [Pseudomonadota bacterium]|nr:NAD(P)/FAD-dependent oxidoreductase [Pseudomonadota bacterium]